MNIRATQLLNALAELPAVFRDLASRCDDLSARLSKETQRNFELNDQLAALQKKLNDSEFSGATLRDDLLRASTENDRLRHVISALEHELASPSST